MDLILLKPGDPSVMPSENSWATGGSLIDTDWVQNPPQDWAEGKIELVSVHQGLKQQMTTDVSNSARTSGRPVITEFTCVKYVDKTSVVFYDRCLRAKPLGVGNDQPTVLYIARNSGDSMTNIMTFWLRDAMISEIQFQSHPDDMPTEQFKLSFTEIIWEFTIQNTDASMGGNVSSQWSIAKNSPNVELTKGS